MDWKNNKLIREAKAALGQDMSNASVPEVVDVPVMPCKVTPLIALSNSVVAVNGSRQVLLLKANKDSSGKGVLTCIGGNKIKLYHNGEVLELKSGKAEFPFI